MEVLKSVIYEQRIHYPSEMMKKGGLDPIWQVNGQLMGSTLSFPILCVVNIVCYWRALNRYRREIGLPPVKNPRDLPVLVNGDDILFRTDPTLYSLWREEIKISNLKLSVGKNYVHPTYLTINSLFFKHTRYTSPDGLRRNRFDEIPYFNVGLLTGQTKLTGRQVVRDQPIWDHYDQVLRGANDSLRAHQRFVHYHKREVETYTLKGNLNLFLPRSRGGLGFSLPTGMELLDSEEEGSPMPYITSFQRKFATFLKDREKKLLSDIRVPKPVLGLRPESKKAAKRRYEVLDRRAIYKAPFGPLLPTQSEDSKRFHSSELLQAYEEADELKYRLPDRNILRAFRVANPKAMLSRSIRWSRERFVRDSGLGPA